MFCEVAVKYSKGDVSFLSLLDGKASEPNAAPKTEINLAMFFSNPIPVIKTLKQDVFRSAEKQGVRFLWSSLSTKQIYWLIAAYFIQTLTLQSIVYSVTAGIFTGASMAMVILTIQIAAEVEISEVRRDYLTLFQYFSEPGVKIENTPKKDYLRYAGFFVALVIALVTFGFSQNSVLDEILVIVSLVVILIIVLQFDLYESYLMYFLLFAKFLSWMVVFIDKVCTIFHYQNFMPKFLIYSFPLPYHLSFDIYLVSMIQVPIHIYLIFTQLRKGRDFSHLGPHILFLCWSVLLRNFVSMSDPWILLKITALIFIFYPPFFPLLLLYFFYFYGFTYPFFYAVMFAIGLGIIVIIVAFTYKYVITISLSNMIVLVVVMAVPVMMFFSAWYTSTVQPSFVPPVSSEEYNKYCGPAQWKESKNTIKTQINCLHLENRMFTSQGYVESVGISAIENRMADRINFLPTIIQEAITCFTGEIKPMCDDETTSTCVPSICHFQNKLRYRFEVKLKIPLGKFEVEATLLVKHQHRKFVQDHLESGTSLEFNATFVKGMGSSHLTLHASSLKAGINTSKLMEEESEREMMQNILYNSVSSIKNTIVVLLEIIFGYIP